MNSTAMQLNNNILYSLQILNRRGDVYYGISASSTATPVPWLTGMQYTVQLRFVSSQLYRAEHLNNMGLKQLID
jgi:hypothetical protein